jgi:hypothetical protein
MFANLQKLRSTKPSPVFLDPYRTGGSAASLSPKVGSLRRTLGSVEGKVEVEVMLVTGLTFSQIEQVCSLVGIQNYLNI